MYVISGDMLRGSVIDSDYKGISTVEIMNLLAPDVATVGNQEVDYGVAHLLFLEKCAKFPIINANMYLTGNQTRLFRSHWVRKIGGMKILFIGVLTAETLAQTRRDPLIGSMINIRDAAEKKEILRLEYEGKEVEETQQFLIGLHEFHYQNMAEFLKVSIVEAEENRPVRKLSTSSCDILDEWMSGKELISDSGDERIVILP